jgi:hypothetical protein
MDEPSRYALVAAGVVVNVILWDGNADTWSPPDGTTAVECPDEAGIGWTYADGNWSAPEA